MTDPDTTVMPLGISAGRKVSSLSDPYLRSLAKQGPLLQPDWLREAVAIEMRRRKARARKQSKVALMVAPSKD